LRLTAKKPSSSIKVTVRIQNRGGREERIPTIDALATLVDLQIESLGACASPTPTLRAPGSLSKKPLVLKPKRSMSVRFDVPIGCANDPAKSPKGESSAHDYGFVAQLGAFGGADSQPLDDVCPRPAVPATGGTGAIRDRGCGAPLGKKEFGGPVLIDVVGSGTM